MDKFVIFFAALMTVIVTVNGYCDFKSRSLQTGISRSIVQATRSVIEAQDEDGKWIDTHTTGNALAVLRLLGYNLNEDSSCSKTFEKAANYFKASKEEISKSHGGQLAYIIMGLNALCLDPSEYEGMNLTDNLLQDVTHFPKGKFNHFFQYSLALMTLGINDVQVPWFTVDRILNKVERILRTGERHSKDTCSLFVMALQSVVDQFIDKGIQLKKITKVINKLNKALAMKTRPGADNLYTLSLVMQAQSAVGKDLPWKETRCENLYTYLINQKGKDGSFGSLSAALHLLPSFAGVSYLDLKNDTQCIAGEPGTPRPGNVNVRVNIACEATGKPSPDEQILQIANGSTALDALRAASERNECYEFETKTTSWGESLTTLCKNRINHAKFIYWMFYVNGKMASTGVGKYVLKEGDTITLKYQKLNLKK